VQIQAQNGAVHLSAEQKLSLISASDMLFAGKKKVTLIGGGSYLIIEGGKIEYGTDSTYTRRVKRTHLTRAASVPFQAVAGSGICLSCLMKAAMNGNAFVIRGEG